MARAVRVGKGDTVHALSRRHGVSPRGIIEANNLKPPYYLKVGQRIVLPRPNIHVVRSGETLYGISRAHGTDTFTIARTNRLKKPYRLHAGDRLTIPTGGRNRVSKASTVKTVVAKPADKSAVPNGDRNPLFKSPAHRREKWQIRVGRSKARLFPRSEPRRAAIITTASIYREVPVLAAENGVVVYAGNELRGFGKLLLIKHADNYVTAYAHNEALFGAEGRSRAEALDRRVGSTVRHHAAAVAFRGARGKTRQGPVAGLCQPASIGVDEQTDLSNPLCRQLGRSSRRRARKRGNRLGAKERRDGASDGGP